MVLRSYDQKLKQVYNLSQHDISKQLEIAMVATLSWNNVVFNVKPYIYQLWIKLSLADVLAYKCRAK